MSDGQLRTVAMNSGEQRQIGASLSLLLAFIAVFTVLGLPLGTAVLASTVWITAGFSGGWLIQSLVGGLDGRHRMALALGPGVLLALGLVVLVYLTVQGGWLGLALCAALLGCGSLAWLNQRPVEASTNLRHSLLLPLFLGAMLLANSKEFPNLLIPALGVLLAGVTWASSNRIILRSGSLMIALGAVVYDVATRPTYWWWSSDDTTTLSAIGTIIIERGRVADIAGWSTSSHHWLLHAWLALWNEVSFGQIFETYLIMWPVVAAVSLFASLWLCVELFLGVRATMSVHVVVAVMTAGFARLEWPAPQEQQPFVFAMVACSALWLDARRQHAQQQALGKECVRLRFSWRVTVGLMLLFAVVPMMLFAMKPSLLVAWGLTIVGTALAQFNMVRGKRLVIAGTVSLVAIVTGLAVMWLGESWVSRRSFTQFSVTWFPDDLGWCHYASKPGSLACVLSLQVVLIVAAVLAGLSLWLRRKSSLHISMVVLLPLVIAYIPLRYFISSGVGSGAPSFYRLSEMALMLFVAIGAAAALVRTNVGLLPPLGAFALALLFVEISEGPSRVYDTVDRLLVGFSPLRYLSASDMIALGLAVTAGLVVARLRMFGISPMRYVVASLLIVSMLPIARITLTSATTENDPIRLSRPADFGSPEVDEVASWLRDNTGFGTLMATNYLCPTQRLSECTYVVPEIACARHHPSLMSSWALMALSKREFLYLSQGWDSHTLYYFMHKTSTRLGAEASLASVHEMQDLGVAYYIASRSHTNPKVWPLLQAAAAFETQNFVVVSLDKLTVNLTA
jgi:hypothetical protein